MKSRPSYPTLARPPIVEALIDLRADLSPGTPVEALGALEREYGSRYPERAEQSGRNLQVPLTDDGASHVREASGPEGFHFRSADGRQVVQVWKDGFTFNRLKPYPGWEAIRDEARARWTQFERRLSPLRVTRVALRTINRIEIPLPVADLRDFVRTGPQVADGAPQGLREFFMRLVVPDPGTEAVAILTEAMEIVPAGSPAAPLLLDLDVFREGAFVPKGEEVWEILEQLHDLRNRFFFSSVTSKTLALLR